MSDVVCVEIHRPSYFSGTDFQFRTEQDMFRNSIILSSKSMNDIGVDEFEYVESTLKSKSFSEDFVILQVMSFAAAPSTEEPRQASARTNLQRKIGRGTEETELVKVRKHPTKIIGPLPVYRGYSDEKTGYQQCYLGQDVLDELGLGNGDYVEVYNPSTGGRMPLQANVLRGDDSNDVIRLSGQARRVLQAPLADEDTPTSDLMDGVCVRTPIKAKPSKLSLPEKTLSAVVGYREFGLRIRQGKDRDEHRNAVRISEDLMKLLAVDPGDKIVLEWNEKSLDVRCLLPPVDGMEMQSMEVLVPSTIRDQLDVSLDDVIQARRDVFYIFKKQVAVSTIGIIGVFIGVLQASIFFGLTPTVSGVLVVVISFVIVWVLLLPERQKCS